jgi:hypothetical protein
MTASSANFADLINPIFNKIFIDALAFGEKPPIMESVFNVQNMGKRAYVDDSYVTGMGLIPEKDKGSAVSYDDIYQGLDKRYTAKTMSMGYRVEKELYEDELYGIIQQMPAALGRSWRATVETDGANVLNRAETSGYTGSDGKTLLATDHTLMTGGTQKNRLTTAADLSATSWEQALIDLKDTTDDRGILLDLKPAALVYPNELDFTRKKLFGSSLDPDSGNNAINPVSDSKIKFVEWSYLTDPDAWFILCEGHMVKWYWRIKPEHYQGNDFDTDDAKFKVRGRYAYGWTVPWGFFGSMGG